MLSEFAIVLNSIPVASTSQETKYTKIIDGSPHVAGYDSKLSYILTQWIVLYFSNKYTGSSTLDFWARRTDPIKKNSG